MILTPICPTTSAGCRCPASSITSISKPGTGFPIDRTRTSDLLGFDAPTGNTYGSIATADYVLESAAALNVLVVGIGRVAQDLLLWATTEVGYIRLADALVQTSSIMPQKRNPVALEHVRALASKASAELSGLPLVMHNTPFGDIVDTEDDLQPLVFAMFRDATRAIGLVASAMSSAEFDAAALEARAGHGWTTLTELADTLVRDHGLPFKTAHAIAAQFVGGRERQPDRGYAALLIDASTDILGAPLNYSEAQLEHILSPRHFVEVRTTYGGPAPSETARAARVSGEQLEADEAWWTDATDALARSERTLAVRSAAL